MNPAKLSDAFTFFIGIIVLVAQVSNSSEFDNSISKDSIHPGNATDYYRYASYAPRRHRRQNPNTDHSCEIPINLHSVYQIIKGSLVMYNLNHHAEEYSILEIKCDTGYKRPPFTSKISTCFNGQWMPIPPACLRTCKSLMSTMSTTVKCSYKSGTEEGNRLLDNCIHPVEGTTVDLLCNTFYEAEAIRQNPTRTCRKGIWAPILSECYPTCGTKTPKGKVNIIGSGNAFPGNYPWQVGVYTYKKEFICGGSVIRQNLVLSAAHCFADDMGNAFSVKDYLIAAGKYYREYDEVKDNTYAQYSNVSEIFIPHRYKSIQGLYGHDIAILLLENSFKITLGVQLVCIELNKDSQNNIFLMNNNPGIVTGWGYTEEGQVLSDVLKELVVPHVPFQKCFDEVPTNFKGFLTFDKLCGGYLDKGTSVCGGDSGGALVNNINDRYFVKGIVSTSPSSDADVKQCNSNQYGLYTSVLKHIEFIKEIVTGYGWAKSIECEQDDCKTLDENLNEVTENSCLLPNFPLNGKYSFPNKNTKYTPGNSIQANNAILLSCDSGYETNSTTFFCLRTGKWLPNVGKCTMTLSRRSPPVVGDKSREKCQEYTKYAYEKEDLSQLNCPITEVGNIVQFRLARPKEFPHIALIGTEDDAKKSKWDCLGTLISENFVLSTANCSSYMRDSKPVQYVQLGDLITDSIQDDARTQQIPIKEVFIHPDYKPPSLYNDIGLIELQRSAILDVYVRPACINTNSNLSNQYVVESGWGLNSGLSPVADNKHMQKATLNIFTQKECSATYSTEPKDKLENGIVEQSQLCAGSRSAMLLILRNEICRAGAPLQIINSGKLSCTYSVIGISSYGNNFGSPNVPGIYTKVSSYLEWIEDIVWGSRTTLRGRLTAPNSPPSTLPPPTSRRPKRPRPSRRPPRRQSTLPPVQLSLGQIVNMTSIGLVNGTN